jgi:hypothetical protein
MALLPEQVPEDNGEGGGAVIGGAGLLGALDQAGIAAADLAQSGEVALHVGEEDRYAGRRQALGQALQRGGLAGAGGAGDQPVAIGVLQQEILIGIAFAYEDRRILAHAVSLAYRRDFS